MKIPFDIKFRPQIESGEYKVETRDNSPVRIICWDANAAQPIIGLVYDSDGNREAIGTFFNNGYWKLEKGDSIFDLFIVTPEPELTEFERAVHRGFLCAGLEDVPEEIIKETAKELIEVTRKELCDTCTKCALCTKCTEEYWRGRKEAMEEASKGYHYGGPYMPTSLPCHYGGECTNPFRDCIDCHRQSTVGINTTTGTSTAKEEK